MHSPRTKQVASWLWLRELYWYVVPFVALWLRNDEADVSSNHQVDEEQRPMNYSQVFQLLPDGQGGYFVFNDVFRLIY